MTGRRNNKALVLAATLAVALAGCGTGEEPATVTQTVTATAEPTTSSTATTSDPSPSAAAILEVAWDSQSEEDQYNMCFGWGYDQETMIDTFFAEAGGSLNITRADVIEFFDGKCG